MSIQGCASAQRVVKDLRTTIDRCRRAGDTEADILVYLEAQMSDIYATAEAGWW